MDTEISRLSTWTERVLCTLYGLACWQEDKLWPAHHAQRSLFIRPRDGVPPLKACPNPNDDAAQLYGIRKDQGTSKLLATSGWELRLGLWFVF